MLSPILHGTEQPFTSKYILILLGEDKYAQSNCERARLQQVQQFTLCAAH